jgi:transposase InsO family protein
MASPFTELDSQLLSRLANPGSRNPFLTPTGQLRRDSPPHLAQRRSTAPFANIQLLSPSMGANISDDDEPEDPIPFRLHHTTHTPSFNDVYGTTRPTHVVRYPSTVSHSPPPPPPAYIPAPAPAAPVADRDVIKEKTMAGVPPWPTTLRLSLTANNWLEWSRELINGLKMAQLHVYPLGTLPCPNQHTDRISHRNWIGNDQMVLGYITSHVFTSESQHIEHCATSADAFRSLRLRHEKRGGLAQIQMIQQLMNVRFDRNPANCDPLMTYIRDLVYQVEQIGHVDIAKLACLFTVHGLRTTLPSVHEALAPSIMDGSITLDQLEKRLRYFYELEASNNATQLAFPTISPILVQLPLSTVQSSPSSPTTALPALLPPRVYICSNCKRPGHAFEYCISIGGKMEGCTPAKAIARQRADREAARTTSGTSSGTPSDSLIQLERDGIIRVGGVRYQPIRSTTITTMPTTASIAEVEVNSAMTAADQGEYSDWAYNNGSPSWGTNDIAQLDTESCLLAATDTALIARGDPNPPLYLDSGALAHISCIRTDFCEFSDIEPRTIMGVGNSSVSAIGSGTVEISILGSSTELILRDVLYAPSAGVRLISISRLDDTGHRLDFSDGHCVLSDRPSGKTIATCQKNSLRLYVLPGTIKPPPSLPSSPSLSPPFLNVPIPTLIATPDLETWHRRLGHANYHTVLDMARSTYVTGMPTNLSSTPPACDACIRGKQTHQPVPKSREGRKATKRLERVFVDLTGPQSVLSRSGCAYVMNIIDDCTGYYWTRLLKSKSDAARELREWLLMAENQSGKKLRYLVTDNGELRSQEMSCWCAERGITHQFTAPYTSTQNGRVERLHRTLMNKARSMRLSCNALLNMWDEFILTASYLSTLTASKASGGRTPYELWFGTPPSLSHLHEIGCRAFVFVQGAHPKIAARSVEGVLIGYASNAKAYRCWFRDSGRIIDSFHVSFIEHLDQQPSVSSVGTGMNVAPLAEESVAAPPLANQSANDDMSSSPLDGAASPPAHTDTGTDNLPRRSARIGGQVPAPSREESNDGTVRGTAATRDPDQVRDATSQHKGELAHVMDSSVDAPIEEHPLAIAAGDTPEETPEDFKCFDDVAFLVDVEDPDAPEWPDALKSDERESWLEGAKAELDSLREMNVFELILHRDVPPNRSVLRGKFVCRLKHDEVGNPVRYKVCWVAKGFQQVWGRDFSKTTSPTARLESLRIVLHIAAANDWVIEQYDVKTAFLNGILPDDKVQYMEQPPGFAELDRKTYVWRLIRSLYGMRQSSRIWNRALNASFLGWGFSRSECEWCVYSRYSENGKVTIVVVHVDDMAAVSSSRMEADRFRTELESSWQITALGEPKLIVGIAIRRDRTKRTIALSQTALIDKIILAYGQKDATIASTPMNHGTQLLRPDPQSPLDDEECERLDALPYRSLVGSLMYVASGSRPDIMFAVSKLSRFLDCYREIHWQAAIRVVRYLKGTRDLALEIGGSSSAPSLIGYCDSDYASDLGAEGRRSVSGYCFTLGSGVVSWSSKKQKTIADSMCAAEYMAALEAGRELVWLRTLLRELGFGSTSPTPLLCDNTAAVLLCGDQAFHNRVKHIDVKYHWIRERVENGEVLVGQIPTSGNVADALTSVAVARAACFF